MALAFGTSGLRGLVTELDDATVAAWTRAFIAACPPEGALFVGRDLRPSSPRIAETVLATAEAAGVDTVDCGVLPTPALALAAAGQAAVMVTGSHIPADRNGLKFYVPAGEISKVEEAAISAAYGAEASDAAQPGQRQSRDALGDYAARYIGAFGGDALAGLRIGVYQHSSVARDVMVDVLAGLGATPVPLARSESFIPVDTEAVDQETRDMLAGWCKEHQLDALVSTDGDADRPMLTDASGQVIPGDVLGVLTAQSLGADHVVTPVSSNSMVNLLFPDAVLTRIGSPYVIAGMDEVQVANPEAKTVGFEANGGFLLGFEAQAGAGALAPLATRDSLLPIIAPLVAAKGQGLAALVTALPPRFTAADRLQEIDRAGAAAFLTRLDGSDSERAAFLAPFGGETGLDRTDGLRMSLEGGRVLHLRPSGNAPEFRVYVEADSAEAARELLGAALLRVADGIAAG
ncbi:MAG: phosphomannomutase [Maritimibacter sp.]